MHTYFDSYFHPCLLFKCYSSVQRGGIQGLYYKSCPFTSHILHFHCFSDKEVKKLLMASGTMSFTESAPWNTWRINAWIHFNVEKKKFYWWFSGPLRGSVYFSKISLVAECKCPPGKHLWAVGTPLWTALLCCNQVDWEESVAVLSQAYLYWWLLNTHHHMAIRKYKAIPRVRYVGRSKILSSQTILQ